MKSLLIHNNKQNITFSNEKNIQNYNIKAFIKHMKAQWR